MTKRSLDFQTIEEVIDEINRLRHDKYQQLGKWNLAQICEHLSGTIKVGLDGGFPQLPRLIQKIVTEPFVRRIIRTRRMASGMPTVKALKPAPIIEADQPAAIDECIAQFERANQATDPFPPHPFGNLSAEQWKQLQCVHAAHHLGFLIPEREQTAATA